MLDFTAMSRMLPGEAADFTFRLDGDGYYLFEAWSPAGEDLPIEGCLLEDSYGKPPRSMEQALSWLKSDIERSHEDFDVDDHVDLWAQSRGERGVPATYGELVEDAEAIDRMLEDLALAVRAWELQPA